MEYSKDDTMIIVIDLSSENVVKFCDSSNIVGYCNAAESIINPQIIYQLLHNSWPPETPMLPLGQLVDDMYLRHTLYHNAEYLTTTFDKIAVEKDNLCESEFIFPLIVFDYYAEVISSGFSSCITVTLKNTNTVNNTNTLVTLFKKDSACDFSYVFNIIFNQESPEEYEKILEMCKLVFCSKDREDILLSKIKQSIGTCITNLLKIDSDKFDFLKNYSQNQSFTTNDFANLLRHLNLSSCRSFHDALYESYINENLCSIFCIIQKTSEINLINLNHHLKQNYMQYTVVRKCFIEIQKNIEQIQKNIEHIKVLLSDVLKTKDSTLIDQNALIKRLSTLVSQAQSSAMIILDKIYEIKTVDKSFYAFCEKQMTTLHNSCNILICMELLCESQKPALVMSFDNFLFGFDGFMNRVNLPQMIPFTYLYYGRSTNFYYGRSTMEKAQIMQAQASSQSMV